MKKMAALCVCLMVFFGLAGMLFHLSKPKYPQGMIYNYADKHTVLLSMGDYLALDIGGRMIKVCDRQMKNSLLVADSAFSVQKSMAFLFASNGNTLYYYCRNPKGGGIIYYSFDADTCDQKVVALENIAVSEAGLLGVQDLLGFSIRASSFSIPDCNLIWINNSGIHTIKERLEFLKRYDRLDQYGLYDVMSRFSETDEYIFFINYFGEIIKFDKVRKSFSIFPIDEIVEDFFITKDRLYYTTVSGALFSTDFNGGNCCNEGVIRIDNVKFDGDAVYIQDHIGDIYELRDHHLQKTINIADLNWTVMGGCIYCYDLSTDQIMMVFD